MKKSKFTEEQIAFALRQAESGTTVAEVCRKIGHRRGHLLQLEEEVRRPRRQRAAPLEAAGRRECPAQAHGGRPEPGQADAAGSHPEKAVKPARKRELANFLIDASRVSIRRATAVAQLRQGTYFYRPHPRDDRAERQRIREIAATRIRWRWINGRTNKASRWTSRGPGNPRIMPSSSRSTAVCGMSA